MIPSPRLLTSLMRSRLLVRRARATIGVGERRSRSKGSGMEFIDYREYHPGDDVRHLDPHLYARTGGYFVRQHAVYQQLPIVRQRVDEAGHPPNLISSPFACALLVALPEATWSRLRVFGKISCYGLPGSRIRRAPVIFDWLAWRPRRRLAGEGAALPHLACGL
jgi:hypothetical protein